MIETSPTIGAIAAALAKAQAAMGGAAKDSANLFFNSSYADLESVTETLRKPATDNDLSWVQSGALLGDGTFAVTTILAHKSGEWIKTVVPMRPKDMTPQTIGSAMTYGRRYGLAAVFGVYQTDDDGNAAQGHKVSEPKLDEAIRDALQVAASKGIEAFRDYWKGLDKDARKAAQADKAYFDKLRATAENVGKA